MKAQGRFVEIIGPDTDRLFESAWPLLIPRMLGGRRAHCYSIRMEVVDYFDRVRQRTMRVVACVPPDRIDWTFKEGKFTFGDLMRHLASIERWMFAENVHGRPSRYPGHGRELAEGYDGIIEYMRRMHEESMTLFRALTEADLQRKCSTPAGAELQVAKWLRLMIEHEIHHRGQIYTYLSMLDVPTPPLYGLTEEQVKASSRRD